MTLEDLREIALSFPGCTEGTSYVRSMRSAARPWSKPNTSGLVFR